MEERNRTSQMLLGETAGDVTSACNCRTKTKYIDEI